LASSTRKDDLLGNPHVAPSFYFDLKSILFGFARIVVCFLFTNDLLNDICFHYIYLQFASSLKAAAREEANTVTTFSILLDDDSRFVAFIKLFFTS
jgi:hypothetical protein